MTRSRIGLTIALLAVAGCEKKTVDSKAAAPSAEPAAPATPTPSATAASPKDDRSRCEQLVPEKYRGAELQAAGVVLGGFLGCNYSEGGSMKSSLSIDCRRGRGEAAWKREFEAKGNELGTTIGRGTAGNKQSANFLDGQADCIVSVALFGDDPDVTELAREIEGKLTAENAPAPPPRQAGEPDLACDKIVGDEIKQKHGLGALEKEEFNVAKQVSCTYPLSGGGGVASVDFDCRVHWAGGDEMKRFSELMAKQNRTPAEARIGAAALTWKDGALVADYELPCNITIALIAFGKDAKKPDVTALATDLEKAFAPAAVGL
jgi:hypothetical protein